MSVRVFALASVLLAACVTPAVSRPVPLPSSPRLVGAPIQLASAPAPSGMERAAITKKDLDLARALLTRAREELHPDQWADLDRKLADAERAWEQFEVLVRESGRPVQVPRAIPAAGLVATAERISPLAAKASTAPLLALLGSFWPTSVADGTLPAWSAAELALATRLSVLADTAKHVQEDLETKRRRYPYVVRLQAQGDGVEESVVLVGPMPITIAEGLTGLQALRGKLTKKELQVRDKFFQQAERFVRNAHGYGVGPPGKSFGDQDSDTPNARVDVEILFGVNFQR